MPSFHKSVRKSQLESPKFYLFDNGVKKALEHSLESRPIPGTSGYGELFESFVIQEVFRLNQYFDLDYRMSFFATKHGNEIDLILSRAKKCILIEIKSSTKKDLIEIGKLSKLILAFGKGTVAYYLSNDPLKEMIDDVKCLFWMDFFKDLQNDFY